jgi:hypothetical protein
LKKQKKYDMKKSFIFKGVVFSFVIGAFTFTGCVKKNETASQLDRQLAVTDSTIFAQYYDSTVISTANTIPSTNDVIGMSGVASIVQSRCATVNCHGGSIAPKLSTYAEVKSLTTPGNPEGSKLFQLITTNDFHRAMPPVYAGELTTTEKVMIYNWIKNGSKETPGLEDFRPAAVKLIVSGCASVQCHNSTILTGRWATTGLLGTLTASDTSRFTYTAGGAPTTALLVNQPKSDQIWNAYKDSMFKYFADTLANESFRAVKTIAVRSPFNNYNDVLLDILYPKGVRNRAGNAINKGDYLNSTDCFIRRIDSTLIFTNPRTGVATSTNGSGSMAYQDGHWIPSEIALIKAWYFADPNIPDVWKYGISNQGIFKYTKGGKVIKK